MKDSEIPLALSFAGDREALTARRKNGADAATGPITPASAIIAWDRLFLWGTQVTREPTHSDEPTERGKTTDVQA